MSNCYRLSYEIWIEGYTAAGLVSSLVICFRWQRKFYCFDFPSPLIALPTLNPSSDQYKVEPRALPPCSPLGPCLSCKEGRCSLKCPGLSTHSCSLRWGSSSSHRVTVLILACKPIYSWAWLLDDPRDLGSKWTLVGELSQPLNWLCDFGKFPQFL